jgi:MFS family permease
LLSVSQSTLGFSLVFVAGGCLASHNVIEGSCIVDATSCPVARAKAFGQLFAALGLAFVLGPIIGGQLSALHSGAPFVAAMMLSIGSLLCVGVMPEYLPEGRRRSNHQSGASVLSTLHGFKRLVGQNHQLWWYVCASALFSTGISAFITVRTIWAHYTFGWTGPQIGRVVGTYGVTVVFAHFVLLPLLLAIMRGREALLAQLCLLVHTARFAAYGLALPHGGSVYTAIILSSAGNCSVPILQALCSRCVPEADQSLLSGGASALNTATQVVGALIGSHVFAHSLAGKSSASDLLLLCAMFCGSAAICVRVAGLHDANKPDQPLKVKKRSGRTWIAQAEGMHGMDATLPSPTMRGGMLFRGQWGQSRGSSPRNLAVVSQPSKSDGNMCLLA